MPSTTEIIHAAGSLPVEQRALVVDALLRTLNAPNSEVDEKWVAVANRRLAELQTGKTKAVSGEDVFENIRKRFA